MKSGKSPPQCDRSQAEFEAIVTTANSGNPQALDRLRQVLDDNPNLWQSIANLGGHSETILIRMIAGTNALLRESLQRQVAEVQDELCGHCPGLVQEMTAQRVTVAWLHLSYVEAICPAPITRPEQQRYEVARRQLDRALRTWKAIRSARTSEVLPRPLRVVG